MLELKGIVSGYGRTPVLHDVSLSVGDGEIVTLIGSNGAGKSTTLRTVQGLLRPRAGEILLGGRPIHGIRADAVVRLGIAHCPEGRLIFPRMTVRENLELGAYTRKDRDGIRRDIEKTLETFPRLRERIEQKGGTLSGGEQQMLAIGRALMARPTLLLLDEPSLGLAPMLVAQIFGIIREINKTGTSVLLVEQNARMALKVASRGYVLETGRIVLEGPASELAENEKVKKAYLGM